MKKKIVAIQIISMIIALLSIFSISALIINHQNYQKARNDLSSYLNITCQVFDGNNFTEVQKMIDQSDSEIRITIIDLDGKVIIDSSLETNENHLDRDEIKNLGTYFIRTSNSLKTKMMYVATLDDGYYLRLALPIASINSFVYDYLLYGSISIIALLSISILVINVLFKKTSKPIKQEINKLEIYLGEEKSDSIDFEHLSQKINLLTTILDNKVTSLINEKEKEKYILNNIDQGLIILDTNGKVSSYNMEALKMIDFSENIINQKSYIDIFRDINVQAIIDNCYKNHQNCQINMNFNGKVYSLFINYIDEKWAQDNNIQITILMVDITLQENIEKMKRDFFANASHELKSPLTSIIGYQELINNGVLTTQEEINDATLRTIKEAQKMNKIIIEMLDLSRIESKIKSPLEETRIDDIVIEVISSLKLLISSKNIEIQIDTKNNFVLMANRQDLYKLIRNIVENAVVYNKDNGKIKIVLDEKNKLLTVSDTGYGISKKDLPHIFERFYRGDKNNETGTGLGLSIVKHICLAYGYQYQVESNINQGTTCYISFLKQ